MLTIILCILGYIALSIAMAFILGAFIAAGRKSWHAEQNHETTHQHTSA